MIGTLSRERWMVLGAILSLIGAFAFAAGIAWGLQAHAEEPGKESAQAKEAAKRDPKIVYPKKTELDFEGLAIEGEVKNPGEFYFQHRNEEKFDSLVQRRKNFHREMLRDAVLSK